VTRYTDDGANDPTFASSSIDFSPYRDVAYAIAVQNDGKVVAVGGAGGTPSLFALVRYLADGSFDPAFGNGGKLTTLIGFGSGEAHAIAIQPDGKLLVAGKAQAFALSPEQFAIARYLPDGQLDPEFGNAGRAFARFAGGGAARGIALQPDGTFFVAGGVGSTDTLQEGFAVVRFLADGTLDPSFGVGGRAVARYLP
jgi:uncharacterized delta-60 repeat protein